MQAVYLTILLFAYNLHLFTNLDLSMVASL